MRCLTALFAILTLSSCFSVSHELTDDSKRTIEDALESAATKGAALIETTSTEARALLSDLGDETEQAVAQAGEEARKTVQAAQTSAEATIRTAGQEASQRGTELIRAASTQAQTVIATAADKLQLTAASIIEKAGERLDKSVTHAAEEFQKAGDELIDRAATKADTLITRAGDTATEATERASQQTRDFLDHLGEWWQSIVGVTATAILGAIAFFQKRKRNQADKVNQILVTSVESAGDDNVKDLVRSKVEGTRDEYRIREYIKRKKNGGPAP